MADLSHDNLNPFIGVCVEPGHLAIVMLYQPRGSLEDILLSSTAQRMAQAFTTAMSLDIARVWNIYEHSFFTKLYSTRSVSDKFTMARLNFSELCCEWIRIKKTLINGRRVVRCLHSTMLCPAYPSSIHKVYSLELSRLRSGLLKVNHSSPRWALNSRPKDQ